MQYLGSKARISKKLAAFLDTQINPGDCFVDLFCGSMNIVSKITATESKVANDSNQAVISVYQAALNGYEFPDFVSEEDYQNAKLLPQNDPLHGFILIGCSFSGKYKGDTPETRPEIITPVEP